LKWIRVVGVEEDIEKGLQILFVVKNVIGQKILKISGKNVHGVKKSSLDVDMGYGVIIVVKDV